MNKKLLTIALAGTFFTMALLPGASMAGKGKMGGQGMQSGTRSTLNTQTRQKIHDGTGVNCDTSGANTGMKKGSAYGPGEGTGNDGVGPKDGTGYGPVENHQ
jgi:hypothetical protein